METWIILIIIAVVIVLVINILWNRNILYTQESTQFDKRAVGVYYLPETVLVTEAKARVLLRMDGNHSITYSGVIELDFKISPRTEADTGKAYELKYHLNPFSSDEIEMNLNEQGLLETVKVTSDSQTPEIFSALSNAPSQILPKSLFPGGKKEAGEKDERIIVKEYTRIFRINAWDTVSENVTIPWQITVTDEKENIAGINVDAGFTFSAEKMVTGRSEIRPEIPGLLFRRRVPVKLTVSSQAMPGFSLEEQLSFLDKDNPFNVPVRNTPFVRRVQELKISNGELLSHKITNPSSVEGFISIPVDVAKAIVSIPAQILRFRIDNLGNKKALESAKLELEQAAQKNRQYEIEREKELIEHQLELRKSEFNLKKTIEEIKLKSESDLSRARQDLENVKVEYEKSKLSRSNELLETKAKLAELQIDCGKEVKRLEDTIDQLKKRNDQKV